MNRIPRPALLLVALLTHAVIVPLGAAERPAPVHEITGKLTLEEAVQVSLRQNPAILRAIQQIEVTRGQIIQVRAQALPRISVLGTYNQQDPNLLEGGPQWQQQLEQHHDD